MTMHTAVPEHYRQKYLAAMGVTSWLPVKTLPASAPSAEWRWQSESETHDSQKPVVELGSKDALTTVASNSGAQAKAATSAIQELLNQQSIAPSANPQTNKESTATPVSPVINVIAEQHQQPSNTQDSSLIPGVDSSPTESEKARSTKDDSSAVVPRFRLAVISYSDCLVVNELPLDVLQGMTSHHQQLLSRILASVGLGSEAESTQLLAWPVVNSSHVDQGAAVARAGVVNLISRLQVSNSVPLFLLGETALEFSLQESLNQPANIPQRHQGRIVLASVSLNELMRVPGAKRELWHQLINFKGVNSLES